MAEVPGDHDVRHVRQVIDWIADRASTRPLHDVSPVRAAIGSSKLAFHELPCSPRKVSSNA